MIKPAGHRVLVRKDTLEQTSKGGIVLFTDDKEDLERAGITTGVIVGVGFTAWVGFANDKPWAEVGDHIYFTRHSGATLKDEDLGEDLTIIRDEDVLAIISKGDNNE